MSTKLSDYDFNLPEHLIAQTPLLDRSSSKLLVIDPIKKELKDKVFNNIIDELDENDVLVINDSKVIPARLFGEKKDTHAKIELLLLDQEDDVWNALVKPAKRIKLGDEVLFGDLLIAKCVSVDQEGIRKFKMIYQGIFLEVLDKLGTMPLPPYIKKQLDQKDRYQTIYCKDPGSVAAPTAGLHFTNKLLKQIKEKNIEIIRVTLHVGLGTFRPVSVDDIKNHDMHSEKIFISKKSAESLNNALLNKKRIVAVGTTSTRTLESAYNNGCFVQTFMSTDIFISPGYKFKVVDAQITNFHLPKSTLMMLVSAFAGRKFMLDVYKHAIDNEYRFFSFGDSMFIKFRKEDNE